MDGKVCLITGGNSGHGKAVAKALAQRGATVVLACRDVARGHKARDELAAATGNERISFLALDLAARNSVEAATGRFLDEHPRLDVLVNNAGAWWSDRRLSPDGIELVWATNVIGPLRLTQGLIGALEFSGAGRILNVSSTFAGGLDLDDVEFSRRPYDGMKAYVAAKQAVRMLTWLWAERLAERPIAANALCPGFMRTGLGRNAPASFQLMLTLARPWQVSPERGADTAVWLASSAEAAGLRGEFVVKRQPRPCSFRDPEALARLKAVCRQYVDS